MNNQSLCLCVKAKHVIMIRLLNFKIKIKQILKRLRKVKMIISTIVLVKKRNLIFS